MQDKTVPDYFTSGRSWYTFHGAASIVVLSLVVIALSSFHRYLKTNIVYPFLFQSRELLQQTPPISDRLKVFALDDSSFSFLGGPRMSPEDLTKLLMNLAEQKPKAILIDGLLSENFPEGAYWFDQLKENNLEVFTGAYLSPREISYRHTLSKNLESFRMQSYLNPQLDPLDVELRLDEKLDWHIYGHGKQLEGAFQGQGHISYNHDGTISPFYRLGSDVLVPHISVFAADSIYIDRKEILVNEKPIPINSKGGLTINYRPPRDFYKIAYPLYPLIKRARNGVIENKVREGDVVLILLAFATGNTDFHEASPFGHIPGGLIIASMISSILENQWITSIEGTPVIILIFAILGTLLGIHSTIRFFWFGIFAVLILYISSSVLAFSFLGIEIPWFLPSIGFCATAFLYFTHNRLQDELKLMSVERNYFAEKARRLEESTRLAKLEGYLSLGRAVQNLLLPREMTGHFRNFDYSLHYEPHLKMAGDWFYIWRVSDQEIRFFIGDVMGKGPSAAIPVASTIGLLKDCERQRISMIDTLKKINDRLIDLYDFHITCTVATATIFADGSCELINTGAPGWFLHSKEKTEFLMLRGNPLGLRNRITVERKRISLAEGQTLFTVTDGYIDGSRNLRKLVKTLEFDKRTIIDLEYLREVLNSHQPSNDIEDDKSLLSIKVS